MTEDIFITATAIDLPDDVDRLAVGPDTAFGSFGLRRLPAMDSDDVQTQRSRHTRLSLRLSQIIERLAERAGLTTEEMAGPDTGIISGSSFGCASVLDGIRQQLDEKGPRGVDPIKFAQATHSYPLSANAIIYQLQGPCAAIVSSDAAGLEALTCASDWLNDHRCKRVIVVAYEDFDDPVASAISARDRLNGRIGDVTETMVAILLETSSTAMCRVASPMARIVGRSSFGAVMTRMGIEKAIRKACGRHEASVAGITLSASRDTACRNLEASAVDAIPSVNGPRISFKPGIGDSLGCAGLVDAALLLDDVALSCQAPIWVVGSIDSEAGGAYIGICPESRGAV